MGEAKVCEETPPPARVALCAAVRQSKKRRRDIAGDVGVSDRTLQRWLAGEIAPSTDQWAAAMSSCGVSPASCFLAAELGRADLVGSESYKYIDLLIHQIFRRIATVEEAGEMPLDPRGAARDASLISDSWRADFARRKRFLDEEYDRATLPPFKTRL